MIKNEENPWAMASKVNDKKSIVSAQATSRLIVKNIPRHITEDRLRIHFASKGFVTDCKVMKKHEKSRLFCFIGYKTEQEAVAAKKFFHNSFIDTSRIMVDFAKPQGDPDLPRAWSKHSKGSSAYAALHGKDKPNKEGMSEKEKEAKTKEIEGKKDRFRQFLKVMGLAKDNK